MYRSNLLSVNALYCHSQVIYNNMPYLPLKKISSHFPLYSCLFYSSEQDQDHKHRGEKDKFKDSLSEGQKIQHDDSSDDQYVYLF